MSPLKPINKWTLALLILCWTISQTACTTQEALIGGTLGVTIVGGTIPSHEIEQVYYLGVLDPQEQLPSTIYRVTVRGQASAISTMKFGSGWVPAQLIDSLSTRVGFDPDTGTIGFKGGEKKDELAQLKTGRRLIMFGPEGFREAPANHRLVIVMGASPEAFFNAIDETLGTVSRVRAEQLNTEVKNQLLNAMIQSGEESDDLERLQADFQTLSAN